MPYSAMQVSRIQDEGTTRSDSALPQAEMEAIDPTARLSETTIDAMDAVQIKRKRNSLAILALQFRQNVSGAVTRLGIRGQGPLNELYSKLPPDLQENPLTEGQWEGRC